MSVHMTSITKLLDGLSLEDQVSTLSKKLAESEQLVEKFKSKAAQADKLQKANEGLEKKLDKANHILLRTEESKGKLEELCRELQKCNKEIRNNSVNKIRLLENERQQAVDQVKGTLKDIESSMNEGRQRSDALAADNKKLAEKLKELGGEYENRLQEISKQYEVKDKYWNEFSQARDLEIKILKAKLEQSLLNEQKLIVEKEELAKSLIEGTARVGGALENERHLREQVKLYADKYSQLTESLSAGNAAFDRFKKEIDKLTSSLKKMENEALKWKQKYDEASKNVLVLTMAKKSLEDNEAVTAKKLNKLEQLCRALTARKELSQETGNEAVAGPTETPN